MEFCVGMSGEEMRKSFSAQDSNGSFSTRSTDIIFIRQAVLADALVLRLHLLTPMIRLCNSGLPSCGDVELLDVSTGNCR